MRQKIVAGNWKLNLLQKEARTLTKALVKHTIENAPNAEVVLCVPHLYLEKGNNWTYGSSIKISAQDCSQHSSGAFTGEVAARQISSVGATYVLIGHSERREYFKEDATLLTAKIKQALESGLTPILCCGESLEVRKKETHVEFVSGQLTQVFGNLDNTEIASLVIAYEPIWAIGTGETATPEQAQSMHQAIRNVVQVSTTEKIANEIRILYGGSVKPNTAPELFGQSDIDGGLVGGASLNVDDFCKIIDAA